MEAACCLILLKVLSYVDVLVCHHHLVVVVADAVCLKLSRDIQALFIELEDSSPHRSCGGAVMAISCLGTSTIREGDRVGEVHEVLFLREDINSVEDAIRKGGCCDLGAAELGRKPIHISILTGLLLGGFGGHGRVEQGMRLQYVTGVVAVFKNRKVCQLNKSVSPPLSF